MWVLRVKQDFPLPGNVWKVFVPSKPPLEIPMDGVKPAKRFVFFKLGHIHQSAFRATGFFWGAKSHLGHQP